jgi:hypothetical protein
MGEKTMATELRRPEHVMVRRALLGGALSLPLAYGAGYWAGGADGGLSATIAIAVVAANFAAHGVSLAWAAGISVPMVQTVALGGFVMRMGVILAVLFGLDRTDFFSPLIFGISLIVGQVALLGYEARLVLGGVGRDLEIPPEPAAAAAAERWRMRVGAR